MNFNNLKLKCFNKMTILFFKKDLKKCFRNTFQILKHSIIRNPIAVITRLYITQNEKNYINYIPNSNTTQCNQFTDTNACMTNAASIHSEYTQEY